MDMASLPKDNSNVVFVHFVGMHNRVCDILKDAKNRIMCNYIKNTFVKLAEMVQNLFEGVFENK